MTVNERIALLREQMKKHHMDYYIITSADAHQSEYVPLHWKTREWISGFTGSAGTVIVTPDRACLWADGRYHIQAAEQIAGSELQLFKQGLDGVPDFPEWLGETIRDGETCGFDGRAVSISQFRKLRQVCEPKQVHFSMEQDLIGAIWTDRPAMPTDKAFEHSLAYAGKSRLEKIEEVRVHLKSVRCDSLLLASLDDIAWLLNMRGSDVECTPVVSSYVYVGLAQTVLFVREEKLEPALRASFERDGIQIKDYDGIFAFLSALQAPHIALNPDRISIRLRNLLPQDAEIREELDITSHLKAVKNETEQQNIEKAQIRDGVAMVRFIKWLKESVSTEELEEADMHEKLSALRAEQEDSRGPSFTTIAGYEENAASMHYSPVKGHSKKLRAENMLLVDTGGQYLGGTTDVTRTIILGEISPAMREDFTTVLKSHIAMAGARFLQGAAGCNLDILARLPMWERGLDYKCGTGHGVGYFLSVHEGPQNFGQATTGRNTAVLKPGMYITDEPGIYREGKWGIRTENILLVRQDETNETGTYLSFDVAAYCPIDLDGLDVAMLSQREKDWLNRYHAVVYSKLCDHLDEDERRWLKVNTRAI